MLLVVLVCVFVLQKLACSHPPHAADSVSGVALVLGSSERLSLCVQVFLSVLFQELTVLSGGATHPDS